MWNKYTFINMKIKEDQIPHWYMYKFHNVKSGYFILKSKN